MSNATDGEIRIRITEHFEDSFGHPATESSECSLAEWLADNVDDEDVQEAGALLREALPHPPGGLPFGGGAAPFCTVERVS